MEHPVKIVSVAQFQKGSVGKTEFLFAISVMEWI